jgi:hypothetical protein
MSVVATIDALTRHAKGKKEKSIYVEQAHFVGVDNSDDYYYRFGASSAGSSSAAKADNCRKPISILFKACTTTLR